MHSEKLAITKLIHENLSLIMAFAFSRSSLYKLLEDRFSGEWRFLRRICFEIAEKRADRALLELAAHLRVLDDEQDISGVLRRSSGNHLGHVIQKDGGRTEMHFRDMTNKVLHSSRFEWDLASPENPLINCYPADPGRWQKAELQVVSLAAICGMMMS